MYFLKRHILYTVEYTLVEHAGDVFFSLSILFTYPLTMDKSNLAEYTLTYALSVCCFHATLMQKLMTPDIDHRVWVFWFFFGLVCFYQLLMIIIGAVKFHFLMASKVLCVFSFEKTTLLIMPC